MVPKYMGEMQMQETVENNHKLEKLDAITKLMELLIFEGWSVIFCGPAAQRPDDDNTPAHDLFSKCQPER